MNDLREINVFVRTQEEYEDILTIAERQGFSWNGRDDFLAAKKNTITKHVDF